METSGSDHWTTDMYMVPQPTSHQYSVSIPALQEIDTMGSEVMSDYVVDPNLYYTSAVSPANYYGYVYPGFESPGEWDDHYRFFGLDGQDLHYPGMQTEGLQYTYYTPSGYAQSPYNPYGPFVPGAVVGPDNQVIGTQQYITSPAYHHPVISPGYFPVVFQPGADFPPPISSDPSFVNSGGSAANRSENQVVKYSLPSSSIDAANSGQKEAVQSGTVHAHSSPKPEGSQAYAVKKSTFLGNTPSSSALQNQNSHDRMLPPSVQTSGNFLQGNDTAPRSVLKVSVPNHGGYTDFGSAAYGWVAVDGSQSRVQFNRLYKNGSAPDMLGEKNRGPRASRSKAPRIPTLVCRAYTNKAGVVDAEGNITIGIDQYNRTDFSVNYPNAKFFVIKSYSEDDVHKSIKYNVWSSTPNGNRRLEAAYEDARRMSGGNPSNCPIFLFFSVNASGQFCGVAEMTGPVDFHRDMDFWQQDKWTGSFPVKWHIIKDVPNSSFRHIVLENNENKPVTNSRDTQEILYIPGMNMLTIFKDSLLRTSILDDFTYYEDRQKIMYEEKLRLFVGSYEQPTIFVPAYIPPVRQGITIREPHKSEGKPTKQQNNVAGPEKTVVTAVDNRIVPETESPSAFNDKIEVASGALNNIGEEPCSSNFKKGDDVSNAICNARNNDEPATDQLALGVGSIMTIASLSIDKEADATADGSAANHSCVSAASTMTVDVVTVGSMPVKVNGFVADTFTVGTIPIDSRSKDQSRSGSVG